MAALKPCCRALTLCAAFGAMVLASCGKHASETPAAALVGTWGRDLAQCQIPQEREDAPMVLTESGYDQHETHCTFGKLSRTAPDAWTLEATCSVEGDAQTVTISLLLQGDRLTIDQGGGASTIMRCPRS